MFVLGSSASVLAAPVISHLKTGDSGFATHEFIALYNNGDQAVDLTGWCLVYSSASDVTKTTLACLNAPEGTALLLEPQGYARFASAEFTAAAVGFVPDGTFSAGLSGTSGHVRLLDRSKNEIDKLGWGSAVSPETTAAAAHASGLLLSRKNLPATVQLQDSNNNQADFTSQTLGIIPASGILEQITPDACPNLAGFQPVLPDDYFLDENGACLQDQCDNLDGLQADVPAGYESLDGENCTPVAHTEPEPAVLTITELLPNAAGADSGKEFVEIYNPNSWPVQLQGYQLELGPAFTKKHVFAHQLLDPFSYTDFSDLLTGLTLPNSSASLRLLAPSGEVVSLAAAYDNPKDDLAWALIDGVWQYTTVVTPGAANQPSPAVPAALQPTTSSAVGQLADCGPGKFRNPETNRCKTIAAEISELKPCKPGQERNPQTNRCRSVVNAASSLKPCPAGQERNPQTNRCRKTAALGVSTLADVKDIPAEASSGPLNWLVVGGVLLVAGAYGVYEWRAELGRQLARLPFSKIGGKGR